jgi:hypothetical protein
MDVDIDADFDEVNLIILRAKPRCRALKPAAAMLTTAPPGSNLLRR